MTASDTSSSSSTVSGATATEPPSVVALNGATHHATPDAANLQFFSEYGGRDEIYLGNGFTRGGPSSAGGNVNGVYCAT
ncbi:hypothetical protein L6164_004591 [Bauhinia variegata]|uniref:Uncharacterized protein n=1 Tax=Bauhinia variegata TaxID=167791 RepID=A0ACB9Q5K1_BAUVA|nr:hypothetical protein L6164_004591 [Bauhinia variegata]